MDLVSNNCNSDGCYQTKGLRYRMIIRKAEQSDAKPLAQLAETTFRDTFAAQNTVEDMEAHCRSSYSEQLQSREIADSESLTIVVEQDNQLIAFAKLNWKTSPSCVLGQSVGEIQRLYIDKSWHGKGIAQDVMAECFDILKARGNDVVWLGVWEHNPRAIAFYNKFDFEKVGEHVFPLGNDPQRDIILVRTL